MAEKKKKETKKRGNGEDSYYQTPDGKTWIGQIVIGKRADKGYIYKRFKGKTKGECKDKIKEYRLNNGIEKSVNDIYLGDYLKNYVVNYKKNKLKPTSYVREFQTYKSINKKIGMYSLTSLTKDLIQISLINALRDEGAAYSTIHKVYILLNACLDYAVNDGKIQKNPCALVSKPEKKTFQKKKIRFLTDEEISTFIALATERYKNGKARYIYGVPLIICLYTGLRAGELCALKWSDVDYDKKTLVVNKNIITYYEDIENEDKREKGQRGNKSSMEQDSLKTDEGRIIPLCKTAIEYLKLQRSFAGEEDVQDDDYIVNNSKDIVSATTINHAYVMTCRAAKIENHQGTHTLRHTFASMLIRKDVDIKVVSEILGHKDVAFTYNTYVHIIEEQRASAVNALDDI